MISDTGAGYEISSVSDLLSIFLVITLVYHFQWRVMGACNFLILLNASFQITGKVLDR